MLENLKQLILKMNTRSAADIIRSPFKSLNHINDSTAIDANLEDMVRHACSCITCTPFFSKP